MEIGNLRKIELSELMEREDELLCDISLYEEQLLRLQLTLQKKKITVEEYTDDYQATSSKITKLKETMKSLSQEINSRIKDYDESDYYFDDLDTEELVELMDNELYFEEKLRGGNLYD